MRALLAGLQRARTLVEVFDAGSTRPQPDARRRRGRLSAHERELLSSAAIVAIGAWEAYVEELPSEVLVAQIATDMLLLSDPREQRDASQRALHRHLLRRSTPRGARGLDETLAEIGATLDWDAIEIPSGLTRRRRRAAALLDDWTQRRHRLEHTAGHVRIRRDQVSSLIELIELIARAADEAAVGAKASGTERPAEPQETLRRAA